RPAGTEAARYGPIGMALRAILIGALPLATAALSLVNALMASVGPDPATATGDELARSAVAAGERGDKPARSAVATRDIGDDPVADAARGRSLGVGRAGCARGAAGCVLRCRPAATAATMAPCARASSRSGSSHQSSVQIRWTRQPS